MLDNNLRVDKAASPSVPADRRYCYDVLPNDGESIRVLHLHANHSRIELSLQRVKHTERGYKALSYVWGSPDTPFKATVLDPSTKVELGSIPLTANLHVTLCNLRDSEDVVDTVFWIDQICINQSDNEEKGFQVAMMGDIYRNATGVITQMGPPDPSPRRERRGLALLKRLNRHFSPNFDHFVRVYDSPGHSVFPVKGLPSDFAGGKKTRELEWLVEIVAFGEWATRMWIVQEQLLNANNVMLRGRRLLSWDSVAIIAMLCFTELIPRTVIYSVWMRRRDLPRGSGATDSSPWDTLSSVARIWQDRRSLQNQRKQDPLITKTPARSVLENMFYFDTQRCFNQRDRIYALLAISNDSQGLGIIPNYTADESTVFHDASTRILSSAVDLETLVRICFFDNDAHPTQPSWVIGPARHFLECSPYSSIPGNVLKTHPVYTTTVSFSADKMSLLLRGRKVDSIRIASLPTHSNMSIELDIGDVIYARFHIARLSSWSRLLLDATISVDSVRALCQCLLTNPCWDLRLGAPGSQDSAYIACLWCVYCLLLENKVYPYLELLEKEDMGEVNLSRDVSQQLGNLYLSGGTTTCRMSTPLPDPIPLMSDEDIEEVERFLDAVNKSGRCVGRTSGGRIFNAMNRAQEGDAIVALEGSGCRLWTLRPVLSGGYRLVGDIYVDGYMQGELYDGVDPGEVDYEIRIV